MLKLDELDLTKYKYIIFDMDGTLVDSIGIYNLLDYKIWKLYYLNIPERSDGNWI